MAELGRTTTGACRLGADYQDRRTEQIIDRFDHRDEGLC